VKQILKPTLSKIVLTFTLLIVSSLLWRMYVTATISDTFPFGFPLQFFLSWGPCKPGQNCSEFNGLWLVVDIFFWYAISAAITGRMKRKAQ
jgi:hypothetical protein